MNWPLFASAFTTIFLAELGDKTQLATLAMASGKTGKLAVFLGAALALVATTALAVAAGEVIGRFVPQIYLRRAAGLLFLVLGLYYLVARTGA
jgi:putative Ca2+/H+ antiporter (TMEM165/GDT1 family)